MKKILTYGTFDLLHLGHIRLLREAKKLGDYLIVGLSTDDFALFKGKHTFYNYEQRKTILEAIKYVDEIVQIHSFEEEKKFAINLKPDVFIIGNDYKGKFDYLKDYNTEVVYIERMPNISSSKIKETFNL